MSEKKVYLHYTQAELDRNFDQRSWVSNALEVIERYPVLAAATRKKLKREADVSYGPTPDEVLDIYPAGKLNAPTQVFIHGGAWRNFTKDDYGFTAEAFVPHGINTVMVNFAKVLQVPLPEMAAQVHRAIGWVCRNVGRWGGDPSRIYVSGHSSGAHLAATALVRGWTEEGLPETVIRGAHLISGPYDLEPVLLSARSSYVKLTKEEEGALSPILHVAGIRCPV
jgi:arylformamidase